LACLAARGILHDSDEDEDEEEAAGATGWTEEDDEAVSGAHDARARHRIPIHAPTHAGYMRGFLWAAGKEEKTWGKKKGAYAYRSVCICTRACAHCLPFGRACLRIEQVVSSGLDRCAERVVLCNSNWRIDRNCRYYDADNVDYEISDNEEAEKDEEQAAPTRLHARCRLASREVYHDDVQHVACNARRAWAVLHWMGTNGQ
jgi:hypothetical protein